MAKFDDEMAQAMNEEDAAFLRNLEDDRTLADMMGDTFRGPMRSWTILANVFAVVATALGVWCVVNMVQAGETRDLILWAAGAWAAWTVQVNVKQWLWQRMHTLSILRELKKIELRMMQTDRRA